MDLPLARRHAGGVDVTLLELSEPAFDWSHGVRIRRRQDYLQAQVHVAGSALVGLVVGCLDERSSQITKDIHLRHQAEIQWSSASLVTPSSARLPGAS